MLYYPYGEDNGKETKDSKGARDTCAHEKRVPRQSQKSNQEINASQLEEVGIQTSHAPRFGGYTAKNTHLGSLEDV
jgi:hypothetical protein